MKINGTVAFFGVFILIGSLTAYQFYSDSKQQKADAEKSQIIKLQKDQIDEFSFISGLEKFKLRRNSEGWSLIEPYNDLADQDHMESFISTVVGEKSLSVVKSGSGIDWTLFGLKDPMAIYEFKDSAGKWTRVSVSNVKNFEGNPYLRLGDEESVLVGGLAWSNFANKKAFDFRNKKVFRSSRADVDQIDFFQKGQRQISLKKENNNWFFPYHKNWKVDQNEVRNLLVQVSDWKSENIWDQTETSTSTPPSVKGQSRLVFKLKDQNWVLNLDESKDQKIFARIDGSNRIFQLEKSVFGRLNKTNDRDYRDHKEPFDFEKHKISKMTLVTPLKTVNLVLDKSGKWQLESQKEPSVEVLQDKVIDLIDRLRSLEVAEFIESSEALRASNLKDFKSNHRYELKDDQGHLVFQLSWSDQKIKDLKDKNYFKGTTNLLPEIFYLEASSLDLLAPSQLVSEKK